MRQNLNQKAHIAMFSLDKKSWVVSDGVRTFADSD